MVDPEIFTREHLDPLAARAGEPIVTDQDDAEARHALASCWELVLFHGSPKWDLDTAPGVAIQVLIESAARLWMNLGGFLTERADAVSLGRAEDFARGAALTGQEIARLEEAAGKNLMKGAVRSVPAVNTDRPAFRSSRNYWGTDDWAPVYAAMFAHAAANRFPNLPDQPRQADRERPGT